MHYDRLETRDPKLRERAQFRTLRGLLAKARPRAPALRKQLRGVKLDAVTNRAALATLPVLRKSDLATLQAEDGPLGGVTPVRAGAFARLFSSPGAIFEPEGAARDWWGSARALHAAGFRAGDIVLNAFSYHLTPGGRILEAGCHALGCAVIPAGPGATEQQVGVIAHYRPRAYCGTPDFLKILLDKGAELKRDMSSIQCALVSGAALPASLREHLGKAGVSVRQAYATADLGVIAYETSGAKGELVDGMVVNESVLVEIVRPGTGDPVPDGEIGEVVVTRLCADYPLLRFATGDLSAIVPGASPCGRTNLRLRGWMGRADQTAKVKGMFVHPSQIAAIGKRHPELGRLRLVITREGEQDHMELRAEAPTSDAALAQRVGASLLDVTKLRGLVTLARPGSLPADGKVIADERPIG